MVLLSVQPVTWAASLLTTMFMPRYLGASEIGQLTVLITVTGFLGTVLGLGLGTSLTRRVAADHGQASMEATAGLVLVLGLSAPVALVLAVILPQLLASVEDGMLLTVCLVGMVVATAQGILSAVLIGQQRHARFAWVNGLSAATTSIASVAYLMAGGGLLGCLLIATAVAIVTLVLGWRTAGLGFDRRGLHVRHLADLAREGIAFLGLSIVGRLRIDGEVMLLAGFATQQAIGWWVAAHRVTGIPIFIPALLTTPLLPALSQCVNDRVALNRVLRQTLILALVLTVPICAMILALAPVIPGLLGWHAEYAGTVPLMMVLSVQLPLVATGMVLGYGLVALGEERRWLVVTGLTTVLSVGLAVLAIPFFSDWLQNGAVGMAVVRVICESAMVTGALVLLPPGTVDRLTVSACGRTAIAGGVLAVVAAWLADIWLPLAVLAGGLAYLLAVLALRVVSLDDLLEVGGERLARLRRRLAIRGLPDRTESCGTGQPHLPAGREAATPMPPMAGQL
jgi:O-antigen/teichoic acid export membrane protein